MGNLLAAPGQNLRRGGQDLLAVDTPSGSKLLYTYLAEQLAGYLGVSPDTLPAGIELNEVAYRFLAQGNQLEDIYRH